MIKEQVKGRYEETKGKVKEVAGKVVGNKAMEQEGATQKNTGKDRAVAGADKKAAKTPSAAKAHDRSRHA